MTEQTIQILIQILTAIAAAVGAVLSLQNRTHAAENKSLLLQTKMELREFIDERLKAFMPRAECDLAQRIASREVEALTEHVRAVEAQLRPVEQVIGRLSKLGDK